MIARRVRQTNDFNGIFPTAIKYWLESEAEE